MVEDGEDRRASEEVAKARRGHVMARRPEKRGGSTETRERHRGGRGGEGGGEAGAIGDALGQRVIRTDRGSGGVGLGGEWGTCPLFPRFSCPYLPAHASRLRRFRSEVLRNSRGKNGQENGGQEDRCRGEWERSARDVERIHRCHRATQRRKRSAGAVERQRPSVMLCVICGPLGWGRKDGDGMGRKMGAGKNGKGRPETWSGSTDVTERHRGGRGAPGRCRGGGPL